MLLSAKLLLIFFAAVKVSLAYEVITEKNGRLIVSNENKLLERSKRYLIYYKGGLFKIVLGYAMPIKLGSKQSLAVALNLQWQYNVITNLTQAHKAYPPIVGRRSIEDNNESHQQYSDRQLAYLGIEAILDRNGFAGKECLLKSICENAMNSLGHDGNAVIGQLFHIILTPDYNSKKAVVGPEYIEAKNAGHFGVDCSSLYSKCTVDITDFLDLFRRLHYKMFK